MPRNIFFHNPQCSKSRQTLDIVKQKGVDIDVEEYLKTPPTIDDLNFICQYLNIKPTEIIRTKEKVFCSLNLSLSDVRSDSEWIEILRNNPSLIERPLVIYRNKAAIGRPPENVLKIIE